jgi:hypothetical protein
LFGDMDTTDGVSVSAEHSEEFGKDRLARHAAFILLMIPRSERL